MCEMMKTQINLEVEPLCQHESLALFEEFSKECNINVDSPSFREARDYISSKPTWLPGEFEVFIRTFPSKRAIMLATGYKATASREEYIERLKNALIGGEDPRACDRGVWGAGRREDHARQQTGCGDRLY